MSLQNPESEQVIFDINTYMNKATAQIEKNAKRKRYGVKFKAPDFIVQSVKQLEKQRKLLQSEYFLDNRPELKNLSPAPSFIKMSQRKSWAIKQDFYMKFDNDHDSLFPKSYSKNRIRQHNISFEKATGRYDDESSHSKRKVSRQANSVLQISVSKDISSLSKIDESSPSHKKISRNVKVLSPIRNSVQQ